jgi:hypothetical protein
LFGTPVCFILHALFLFMYYLLSLPLWFSHLHAPLQNSTSELLTLLPNLSPSVSLLLLESSILCLHIGYLLASWLFACIDSFQVVCLAFYTWFLLCWWEHHSRVWLHSFDSFRVLNLMICEIIWLFLLNP